jgi:Histidine kinase-, DNA gyrase B-, and HSP90-like ATPase
LVESLGGKQLYGSNTDLFEIILRELLQNASDAVEARSAMESKHQGSITVRLIYNTAEPSNIESIEVQDNGIGMSCRVLQDVLLDFGTSFWASDIVKSEFPGLASSRFEPAGRFGIGFYSVFMVADRVQVTSRRYDHGLDDVHQVVFRNGLSLRPMFIDGPPAGYNTTITTSVLLHLRQPVSERISVKRSYAQEPALEIEIGDQIAALATGLETPVRLERRGQVVTVHDSVSSAIRHPEAWLRRLCFADRQRDANLDAYVSANAKRLAKVTKNGRCVGFAAIGTRADHRTDFLSANTVGGLGSVHNRSRNHFIGFLDHVPNSARRDAGEMSAPPDELMRWSTEQLGALGSLPLSPEERYLASRNLVEFGVDPLTLLTVPLSVPDGIRVVSLDELARMLATNSIAIFRERMSSHADFYHYIPSAPGMLVVRPIGGGRFNSLRFVSGEPEDGISLAGCLHRDLLRRGFKPSWRMEEAATRNILGLPLDAVILSIH